MATANGGTWTVGIESCGSSVRGHGRRLYEGHVPSIGERSRHRSFCTEYAEDGEALTRFFNEAGCQSDLSHPAIIQVSEFGRTPSGAAFLVMEFLDGAVLSDYLPVRGRHSTV